MATPGERLALLLRVHGGSYRSAAELCGVDHTTIMRVERGETENPATLARIAESYGVPVSWLKGDGDLATDFAFSVLLRPLRDRVQFLCQRERRLSFALQFLQEYAPDRFPAARLAEILQIEESAVAGMMELDQGHLPTGKIQRLCGETGLPLIWFQAGVVGREDEEEILGGLAEWALSSLAEAVGLTVTEEEIREAALALV